MLPRTNSLLPTGKLPMGPSNDYSKSQIFQILFRSVLQRRRYSTRLPFSFKSKNNNRDLRVEIFLSKGFSRSNSTKSPLPSRYRQLKEKKSYEKLPKWFQWAEYFRSSEFQKGMTMYYVAGFIVILVCFYYYMRDRYYEDKQIKHIRIKYNKDPKSLSEYEYLKLKANSNDSLRPMELKKYRMYQMMRKEFRRKHILDTSAMFEPSPEDLANWYEGQARKSNRQHPEDSDTTDRKEEPIRSTNHINNPNIVPPQDTTEFFDKIASKYDDEIKWEERAIFMGARRNWLMRQLKGDVLEVASGSGRNIPYFQPEKVGSITFLDSSEEMMKIAQNKFRKRFPKFQKVGFTVGKAEDLVNLANEKVRYDTVYEAFGLCAHEDPVKALRNMTLLLKPGGRLILLEHGRSTWDFINNHLDFKAEKRMKKWGCRWNLDIGDLVDEAGLDITYEKRVHLGSTWLLVCKRPEDPMNLEEKPFINKLFGKDVEKIKKE